MVAALPQAVDTLVVGAGISGLVHAHALGPDADVLVVEAAARPGGWVRTVEVPEHGLHHEGGPEALAAGSEHVAALARALGLEVRQTPAAAQARYLVCRGRLVPAPLSPPALLRSPLLGWGGKVRLLAEPFRAPRRALDGSIADFARHRLGPQALAALVEPMVAGVHAGDPERLSVRACFPQVVAMVEEHGSLFAALRRRRQRGERVEKVGLWKPAGGMQRLPEALARALGSRLRCGVAVRALQRREHGWLVLLDGGEAVHAARVVLALPLEPTRQLLAAAVPAAYRALADMEAESLAAVVHAHRRADVEHRLDGFGYLVPAREGLHHLGTLFSSSIDPGCVPAAGHLVLLRTLLGGARQPELLARDDAELRALVHAEAQPLLGLRAAAPAWSTVVRYPRALPRLDLQHPGRLARLRSALPPDLHVLGNFTDGVGLTSLVRAAALVSATVAAVSGE